MTREIILLRHADAEPAAPDRDDLARPLSSRGMAEAEAAGIWLRQHQARPDRALCSPALRALATCEKVLAALGHAEVRSEADIYDATPGTLIRVIDQHSDAGCLLLVGHNPGLENLVALLTEGASDSGRGMPPAAIAWLTLPKDAVLEPGAAEVRHFWWP
ncbi:MAG TPA: histidine phosphatase family protein [Rhodanobacteraceae bacterium]|nr:histidine phosphatase family protein [Rhodanobacteraceae bacterium]